MWKELVLSLNIVTFLWAQTAAALTPQDAQVYKNFIQESQVTTREVPLRELLDKFGKTLPETLRVQLDYLVKENPEIVVPKMEVQKVQVNGEDQLQLNVHLPEGNLQMTTTKSDTDWIKFVGSMDGNSVRGQITHSEFVNGANEVYSARAALMDAKRPLKVTRVPAELLSALKGSEKLEYFKSIRQGMLQLERLQNSEHKKEKAASNNAPASIWDMLEKPAFAEGLDAGNSCIIAGSEGTWHAEGGGYCHPKNAGQVSKGFIKCESYFYGDKASVPFSTLAQRQNATAACEEKDSKFVGLSQSIKTAGDQTDKIQGAIAHFQQTAQDHYNAACSDVDRTNTPGATSAFNPYQRGACDLLKRHTGSLNSLANKQCKQITQIVTSGTTPTDDQKDLKDMAFKAFGITGANPTQTAGYQSLTKYCADAATAATPAAPVPAPVPASSGNPSGTDSGATADCTADNSLIESPAEGTNYTAVTCKGEDGTLKTRYKFKDCKSEFATATDSNTHQAVCVKIGSAAPSPRPAGNGRYESPAKPHKSFFSSVIDTVFSPLGLVTLGIAGFLLIAYNQSKANIANQYKYIGGSSTINNPVTSPFTTPVSNTGLSAPTTPVNRETVKKTGGVQ